ncbi:MAG TPA: ribosome small subunit-dependent GTPase A [Ktedonobacterales bacterium]|jgi:ribosome biogenesis GTPase
MTATTDSPADEPQALGVERAQTAPRSATVEGLVVALAPDYFEVAVDGVVYLCTARGRLRKPRQSAAVSVGARRGANQLAPGRRTAARPLRLPETAPMEAPERPTSIATGDRVMVTILGPDRGVIEDIAPRRNALSRARSELETEHVMMANVDLAILVFAVREPEPRLGLLDRYLALCERAQIPALILFNKVDLGASDELEQAMALYAAIGYPVAQTSATTGQGIETLRQWLAGRASLLTGPSGVGKSSLMNVILPEAGQRVGEISEATGKGRHTTTGARLLPLPEGGWLADTAGIRELALWNAPADALPRCFVELRPVADDCEYEDCGHAEGEEGCALRAALTEGRISPSRWESFERLLAEAREKDSPRWLPAGR